MEEFCNQWVRMVAIAYDVLIISAYLNIATGFELPVFHVVLLHPHKSGARISFTKLYP